MKDMKRLLSLLVVLLLSFSLAACSSTEKEEAPVKPDTEQSEKPKEEKPAEQTITVSAAASLQDALEEIAVGLKEKENMIKNHALILILLLF